MTSSLARVENWLNAHIGTLTAIIAVLGAIYRLHRATAFYLNPDEAWSYLLAKQVSNGWWEFYQNSATVAHPPLFILVLKGVLYFGRSELALRSAPVLAGVLFPWFVMQWVRRVAGDAAGVCALLLLTFSPNLASLSAEVRPYALAFLFLSMSLLSLQEALDNSDALAMARCQLWLYVSILTDYSIVWLVAAMGLYALFWFLTWPANARLRTTWAVGQVAALAIYVWLLVTGISQWRSAAVDEKFVSGWLRGAFFQPGDHAAAFAAKGFLRQFKYFMGSGYLAPVAAAAFLFGVYVLWKKRARLAVALLILPFCFACAAAIAHVTPYGTSRHTAFMGIVIAAGIAQGISALTRSRIWPLLATAALLVPIWIATAPGDPLAIPDVRHRLDSMQEAVRFLRTSVDAGSVVVTDRGTDFMLAYYLESSDYRTSREPPYRLREAGGLRIVPARSFQFRNDAELRNVVSQVRRMYEFGGPMWVAAGGFYIEVQIPVDEVLPFSNAIVIFRSPLGEGWN